MENPSVKGIPKYGNIKKLHVRPKKTTLNKIFEKLRRTRFERRIVEKKYKPNWQIKRKYENGIFKIFIFISIEIKNGYP